MSYKGVAVTVHASELMQNGWARTTMDHKSIMNHPLIVELQSLGFSISREVAVSSAPVQGELSAQEGDFWFHTDGCFLQCPPRIICICVIEPGNGGSLSLLSRDDIFAAWPNGYIRSQTEVMFGLHGRGVRAPIWAQEPIPGIFRFRKDYMLQNESGSASSVVAIEAANAVQAASTFSKTIGELNVGEALFVDNWRFLHRRELFVGIRRIVRLWIHQEA